MSVLPPGEAQPEPAAARKPSGGARSVFRDLLATHESAPRGAIRVPSYAVSAPAATAAAATAAPADPLDSSGQRSLFGEILDWMLAPLLLLWPLSVAVTFVVARSLADAPFDRALIDHATVLAQQARIYMEGGPLPQAQQLRSLLPVDGDGRVWFQIIASDGEMLRGEADLPPPSLYDFPEIGVIKLRNDSLNGEEVRIAYTHVQVEETEGAAPTLLVQVAETEQARDRLANEIIKGVIFPQFVILPLAVGLVWFGLSRGLSPLQRVRQRLHDRRPDDLSPIDRGGVPAEIAPLVDAFNELLTRLDDRIGAQQRFIADAAHQMKTPLAGLRTQAELALRETDPAQLRRSLEQLAISSGRAAHLISQLLALARTENQRVAGGLQPIDLAPLLREVVTGWVDAALARGIDFGLEDDDIPSPINGHPILLRELFGNLIDNALRYTPAGGRVTVRRRHDGGDIVIEVEDSGPGIALAEREMVFERFYRVLGSGIEGSGLGLAIVREIARQHAAQVSVGGAEPPAPGAAPQTAPAGVGAVFTVRFPAGAQPPSL
jgi:two-component system sensor histidine kinase TctE